ncbi:ATP-dependent DNA helicase [Picrophilus oshimae]|uniref:DNA 3'-5' helicase n=1 Tax=Picrophilus torridus (strain ATCC 700027 / DSM 9790 / JCM 10055 / NBRC 100828 / KAW 2/3) TaxID=1122961 RepID=Q6KZM2_PICTO|nr:ATP-dependent DNA helicase [Picrophilus oshimae]AAT43830.1 ATP-dependent DNA helicase [Picrophilus oshimae DSM 9789]
MENTLIIANPGTGKTMTIAESVARLIFNGEDPSSILCITFTNRAVDEMRSRIESMLKKMNIKINIMDLNITTFHSYAYNYIKDFIENRNIVSNHYTRYLILKALEESNAFNYSMDYIIENLVPKLENAIRFVKNFGIGINEIKTHLDKIRENLVYYYNKKRIGNITLEEEIKMLDYFIYVYNYYEENKNGIDYTDILNIFLKHFNNKIYKYVFVDELQDVNILEYKIALLSGDKIFAVGDRKQSIFGFQGGSLKIFSDIIKSDDFDKRLLSKNYRSVNSILKYAGAYMSGIDLYREELNNFSSDRGDGDLIDIIETEDYSSIIDIIKNLDGTTGIIVRTNEQLFSVSRILDDAGIKYSCDGISFQAGEAKREIITFLKGIFYDDPEYIIKALFTIYGSSNLKEAFYISEKYRENPESFNIYDFSNTTIKLRTDLTFSGIEKIFRDHIIPVSLRHGADYYHAALSIFRSLKDFFTLDEMPTRKDFFDYLSLCDVSSGTSNGGNIYITTVHSAKGLSYDNVIYIPEKKRTYDKFIDVISFSIVKACTDYDVSEDLELEDIRIDFVAFTRARYRLFILCNPGYSSMYFIDGLCRLRSINNHNEINVLGRESWLRSLIYDYFNKKNILSYSLVKYTERPFEFLKYFILNLNFSGPAAEYGLNAHTIAELMYRDEIEYNDLNINDKTIYKNVQAIKNELEKLNLRQVDAEKSIIININDMFDDLNYDLKFYGKIDAIFSSGSRYLIIDYKTDKNRNNANEHMVQLAAYKMLFGRAYNISEDLIDTAIAYIALRGNINTGKVDRAIMYKNPGDKNIIKLKSYINNFIDYKNDPEKFIERLYSEKSKEPLFKAVLNELT